MLINTYLPTYQFSEYHEIVVKSNAETIFPLIKSINFRQSKLLNLLFVLRGLPSQMNSIKGFVECGFILLEEKTNEEIVIGFLFGATVRQIKPVAAKEFIHFDDPKYIKGGWDFRLTTKGDEVVLSTETRVFCPTRISKIFFSIYWFFIAPFSGLVRRIILKLIKKEAEKST